MIMKVCTSVPDCSLKLVLTLIVCRVGNSGGLVTFDD